jgi:F-type H+-transporting ATPase subunit b
MAQTGLLDISPGLIFWTVVTFVVLLLLLRKYVWGPVLDAVDRRESSLKEIASNAEKARAEAQKLLEQYQGQLANARDEVNKLLEDGRTKAARTTEEMIRKARLDSEQVLERAKNEIDLERQKAVDEIRTQVVKISLAAAERLIEKKLEERDHRAFIEQAISEIDARIK